ncbi:MAG: class I tRNA ligase family protein, partial [Haloarculaceae archaeon]
EPLSDSTIYMAYYTIAHRLQDVDPEKLDRAFWDTLFYSPDAVDEPDERALELREEWEYWYPIDFRCSANDLIQNHLTFFLFHHAELFDRQYWPEGITIMGMGLLEGEKMSSSKGHVVLPSEAIEAFGADTVRFFLLNSAEPWQDYDWREDAVASTRDQLDSFWNRAQEIIEWDAQRASEQSSGDEPRDVPEDAGDDLEPIDRWLLSKLQGTIRAATEAMEGFETRTASQAIFYGFEEHLRWYRRRADLDRPGARWTLRAVLRARLRMLAPFVPFMANELHEQLTGEPAEDAAWPEPDPDVESERIELREQLVERLTDDVGDIVDVTGTDPETIRVYVAADWKRDVFETVTEVGPDVGAVMGEVMSDEALREKGDAVNDLVQDLVGLVRERDDETLAVMTDVDERAVYESAARFLAAEFDADVQVAAEDDAGLSDPEDKADSAVPFRPAIYLA